MKHILHLFAFLSFVSDVFADPLLETIKNIKELNTLNSIINNSKNLTALFNSAKDFTFLAPSDSALEKWFAKEGGTNNAGLLETKLLRYHLLRERFTTEEFTEEPRFLHSFMNSTKYSNVTGGQVVELVRRNGVPVILSGNKTISRIAAPADRIVTGGYVEIIDEVLDLPLNLIDSLSQFGDLRPFIAVLNAGGFVDQDESPFIKQLLRSSDITYFAPNTQSALKTMTEASKSLTDELRAKVFGYHLVPTLSFSPDLKDGMKLKTLQGSELTITVLNGETFVNSAKILATDYLIGNGVLHTIDELLDSSKPDPPTKTTIPIPDIDTIKRPKSTGMSGESKAGIAIGVLAVVFLILALVFLLNRRRRIKKEEDTTRDINGKSSSQEEIVVHQSVEAHRLENGNENYVQRRTHVDEIELEASRYAHSLAPSQMKWEYEVSAVELDGTGRR